jgi:uncharacterized protein YijF (DUF1287 family)
VAISPVAVAPKVGDVHVSVLARAVLAPAVVPTADDVTPRELIPSRVGVLPDVAVRSAQQAPGDRVVEQCAVPVALLSGRRGVVKPLSPSLSAVEFGGALAAAARSQLDGLVIYNDKYRRIGYPGGDVQPLYGVCTDVIIRAYRAVGIDLQQLVHESRSGAGDTSIDHRRTETLRRFFAGHGEALTITSVAEDYRPGDVVTYNRPQNRHSRSHIALVSDVLGSSGRYMILHNRGWGPQLEDGLFVDEVTGHYRYRPVDAAAGVATAAAQSVVKPDGWLSIERPQSSAEVLKVLRRWGLVDKVCCPCLWVEDFY